MNRWIIAVIKYIKMTFLLIILVVPVLYGAGVPLVSYLLAQGSMVMVKGAPGYPHGYSANISDINVFHKSTNNISEIDKPLKGSQYGSIYCDRIGLSVPLYYGNDEYSLLMGAGQSRQSQLPGFGGQIIVSGHDTTFFAPLEYLVKGDIVKIMTDYGSYEYELVDILITEASDTTAYDLNLDREQLILYTCYPFGKLIGDRDTRIFFYCDPIITE